MFLSAWQNTIMSFKLSFCFILLLLCSCTKRIDNINDNYITLGNCNSQKINGNTVSLCFNEVLEDSRCPINAVCIWQGVATANFTFRSGSQEANFNLSTLTFPSSSRYNQDTVLFGYKISLLELRPYPEE